VFRAASDEPHTDADLAWLAAAIHHSRHCVPVGTAYCVGAIVVASDGTELARGYSRETGPHSHAEEAALTRVVAGDPRLAGATLYSSLEPCGVRRSRPQPCARLIAATPIRRVVYALREPPRLAPGGGADLLRAAGVQVIELVELAGEVRAVNAHLLS
jgi:diaminohydroxyphosphoribosylaminopyrimidine deaminase / 5-amino-6-(5-phosphoribosylamino)uracil reductase